MLITVAGGALLHRSAARFAVGRRRGVVGPRADIGDPRADVAALGDDNDAGPAASPPKASRRCSAATPHAFVGRSTSA